MLRFLDNLLIFLFDFPQKPKTFGKHRKLAFGKKRQDQEFKYVNMNSRQHFVLFDLAKFSHNILKYSFSEIVNVSGVIVDKNHE